MRNLFKNQNKKLKLYRFKLMLKILKLIQ